MRTFNLIIVGVGGQGILTLGSIIGTASMLAGIDVSVAEVHGMSQRGGSVIVHVRIGKEPSPIAPVGGVDQMIALELIEAARYIYYARRDAVVIVNDFLWPPPLYSYPAREFIITSLKAKKVKLYVFDANKLSTQYTGSIVSANIALLGFSLGVNRELESLIPLATVEKALEEHFRGSVLEANLKLLKAAYSEGLKHGRGY